MHIYKYVTRSTFTLAFEPVFEARSKNLRHVFFQVTHYRGKKHLNNVKNSKSINPRPPKGGGMTDPTGGFGIGVVFHKKTSPPEDGVSVEPSGRTTPVADEPLEEGEVVDEGWTPAP